MCSIVGMVGDVPEGRWGETHEILEALLRAGQVRGKDAAGFVALTEPFREPRRTRIVLDKAALPASSFVLRSRPWGALRHHRSVAVLGHTRAATHGLARDNVNNHPHAGRGLYLVHNGVVQNFREIAECFRLRLRTQCDSEVLLRLVEAARTPEEGLRLCLTVCRGAMAVAVLDQERETVWLARNEGRPLWLAGLPRDRRWWFASTAEILAEAFSAVFDYRTANLDLLLPLPCGVVCGLTPTGSFRASSGSKVIG